MRRKKSLYTFYFRDDRTGLPSISKFIRINTWMVSMFFVGFVLSLVVYKGFELTDRDQSLITLVKDFLIFFIPTIEASYQFNRKNKLDSPGMRNIVEELAIDENNMRKFDFEEKKES